MKKSLIHNSKHSLLIISVIAIALLSLAVSAINKISETEQELISYEIEIKLKTQKLLTELRETLSSNISDEIKKQKSLELISSIRLALNDNFFELREEAQKNITILNKQLEEIEQYIIKENFEEALNKTNEIIEDLEEAEDIAFINDNDNDSSEDYGEDNVGNYSDEENQNEDSDSSEESGGDSSSNDNAGENENQTEDSNENVYEGNQNPEDVDYSDGYEPTVDRNKTINLPSDSVPGTQVGS